MWSKEQRDTLSIIYGDDIKTVGDILVARNTEKDKCYLIDKNGQLLLEEQVLGIGQFLGRGGFHYIVITDEVIKPEGRARRTPVYPTPSRFNNWSYNRSTVYMNMPSEENTMVSHYKYKIFNSNFECEHVGEEKCGRFSKQFTVEIGGRIYTVGIKDCIVDEPNRHFVF